MNINNIDEVKQQLKEIRDIIDSLCLYYQQLDEVLCKLMTQFTISPPITNKMHIVALFKKNIVGKRFTDAHNTRHCGSEGHWLERLMGIKQNANNVPDILGYEMKKSSTKITFGDFSASEYAFSSPVKRLEINRVNGWDFSIVINRKDFIHYFGSPNVNKNNRYSWSGGCFPIYDHWNRFGQTILVTDNNDICIYYSNSKDKRDTSTYPAYLKKDNILITIWMASDISARVNNKFNVNGFFICQKDKTGIYNKIQFGNAFNFDTFIECFKKREIFIDSGMYETNTRNYSQFRSRNAVFWQRLIVEEY